MFKKFRHRSYKLERLDTGDYTPEEYALWQREMKLINRWLGDTRALRLAMKELGNAGVSILDVGAGSGELLKAAGRFSGRDTFLVGAELNADAAAAIGRQPGLVGVRCDALKLPFGDDSFDFVITSLFLHHLDDERAAKLIVEMQRVAKRGFVVIDLHRHAAAYYLYRLLGPLVLQRFTVDDGSLSICRAFRADELRQLARQANIKNAVVRRRFAFRLVLTGQNEGCEKYDRRRSETIN